MTRKNKASKILNPFIVSISLNDRLEETARELVTTAIRSQVERDYKTLTNVGKVLCESFPRYELIGLYYQALSWCRNGTGGIDEAQAVFEVVAERERDAGMRNRALIALSNVYAVKNDLDTAQRILTEVCRDSFNRGLLLPFASSLIAQAWNSLECGDLRGALRIFDSVRPVVRSIGKTLPAYELSYLNNYALALSESGQYVQASHLIKEVCRNPIASRFPEWEESAQEIEAKAAPSNLYSMVEFVEKNPSNRKCAISSLLRRPQIRITLKYPGGISELLTVPTIFNAKENKMFLALFRRFDEIVSKTPTPYILECVWESYARRIETYKAYVGLGQIDELTEIVEELKIPPVEDAPRAEKQGSF